LDPHTKKYKKFKNIVGRKPFGLFFLKIEFSVSIGPSSMKYMYQISIFVFLNFLNQSLYSKTLSEENHISRQCSMCITSPFTVVVTYFWVSHKKIQKIQKHCQKKTFWTFLPLN
jgi:hypothetical protein